MAWEPVPDSDESTGPEPARPSCPQCGSDRLRRSAPRGLGERLLRSLSPLHLYRCRACGHRGWRLGALRRMRRHRQPADAPGRPVERRDVDARRARLVRAVMAVVAAVGLGVAAGFVIQTCQSPAPAAAPGP